MAKKVIKQVKRSQNPRMVDGNDRNDMEDMVTWNIKVKMKIM